MKEGRQETEAEGLHAKFHVNVFIVSASSGQKSQFLANFDTWGLLYTDPLLPMKVKFGVLKQTERLHVHAEFHLNMFIVFIVSHSGGHKTQCWHIFNFGGSCTGSLLPIRVNFGVLKQTGRLHLRAKFHLKLFIVSASSGQKPQFWANFEFCGAPVPTPYYRWEPNLVCYSWPTPDVYVSKFVSIGLFYRPLAAKNPNFCRFSDFGI